MPQASCRNPLPSRRRCDQPVQAPRQSAQRARQHRAADGRGKGARGAKRTETRVECAGTARSGKDEEYRQPRPQARRPQRRTRSASRPHAGSSRRKSISWISGRRAFLCFRVRSTTARRSNACTASIAMRATRAPSAAARSGISVLRVPRCRWGSANPSIATPAARRSMLRPCCGNPRSRRDAAPCVGASAEDLRGVLLCGLVGALITTVFAILPKRSQREKCNNFNV